MAQSRLAIAVNNRKVLLISPQFPPTTLAGGHRARHLAKYLPRHGWTPTVITVDERDYSEALDVRLSDLVPSVTQIIKVRALPASVTRLVGVSDLGLRSYGALRKAIHKQITVVEPDIVFITGFPFYPMLLAGGIRKKEIPVVLDFQDPWISRWGASQPALSKAGLAHRLATRFEPKAVAHASAIMSVSEIQNDEMRQRYSWLRPDQLAAIPIGGDWDDFGSVVGGVPPAPQKDDQAPFVISYVGTLGPRSSDLFRRLFEATRLLREERPDLCARLRFRLVGTAAVTSESDKVVTPLAAEFGVADLVDEFPQRVPYLDALAVMATASGQLIVGSDEPHYTASKIYPVLMAGRPFLSIFHQKSSSHQILQTTGGGIALSFNDENELRAMAPSIRAALELMIATPDRLKPLDVKAVEPFTAPYIAKRCAELFERTLVRRDN